MIEQAKLWWIDAYNWQEKLTWQECLSIICVMFVLVTIVFCWEICKAEFYFDNGDNRDSE